MRRTLHIFLTVLTVGLIAGCATETMTGADQELKAQLNSQPFLIDGFTGNKSRMGIVLGDRVKCVYGSLLLFGRQWTVEQLDEANLKMTPLNWTVFDPAEEGCRYDAIGCITIGISLFGFELRVPDDPQNGTLELRIYDGGKTGIEFMTAAALMSRIASGEYPQVGIFTGTIGSREIATRLLIMRPLKLTLLATLTTRDDWLALLKANPDTFFENLDALLKQAADGHRNRCLIMALPALADAASEELAKEYLSLATKDDALAVRNAAILPYCERIKPDDRLLRGLTGLATDRDIDVRRRVVSILSKHDVGTTVIIQRLADTHKDVRELAFVRLDRIDRAFSEGEVAALGDVLAKSPRVLARLSALNLLAKVPVDQSNVRIVPAMGDVDSDVRELAAKRLASRPFTETDLAAMAAIARHDRRSVRREVIPLLAKIKADGATIVLIEMLSDSHGDVRKKAFAAVNARPIGAGHVQRLSKSLNAAPSITRIYAAELLGGIKDDRIVEILTKRLEREGYGKVRQAIILALKRQLSPEEKK